MRFQATIFRPWLTCMHLSVLMVLLGVQAAVGQVTLLAPRDDTRVDFQKLGLRVTTYEQDQIEGMDRRAAITLAQSIDASKLVLTGARMSSEAFDSLFNADEVRVAFDDLFRRGGALYFGQISAAGMNAFSPQMRAYFEAKSLFLPTGPNRPTTNETIGHFTAYANPDLLSLPLLSKPISLAQGDWAGAANNVFYWQGFPDSVLPVLTGPDNAYPVMLLQKDILGKGTFILSQARELTRMARSPFWENLVAQLNETVDDAAPSMPQPAPDPVPQPDAAGKALMFLETFEATAANSIDKTNAFTDPRIWQRFERVLLRIYNTADQPQKPTEARMGIIGSDLIAAFVCHEPDTKSIVANVTTRDGEVWTDDSVEVVIVPEKGGAVHHWLISAAGVIYDARDRIRAWDSNAVAHVKIEDGAWRAVVVIPLTDLFESGEVPETFFANLAREERGLREISSWVAPIQAIPTDKSVGTVSTLSPRELAGRLFSRSSDDARGTEGDGYEVWQSSPWAKGLSVSSKPQQAASDTAPAVALHLPRRGSDASVLLVRNNDVHSLVFKVNLPRTLETSAGKTLPFTEALTLYRGIPRLSSYESLGFDPLDPLGNSSLLTVAPGETAMLWIDAHADSAAAGVYTGELSLLPITTKDQQPFVVGVTVNIYDVQIPDPLPLNVYTWGPYMGALRGYGDPQQYVKLAAKSHINTFNVSYPFDAIRSGPVMSDDTADYLGELPQYMTHGRKVKFVYSYHLFDRFTLALKEAGFDGQPMDATWQSHFVTWFGRWMAALAGAGITHDDFWVQVEDEPRSKGLPDLIAMTAFLKKQFPQVRTMVTIAPWSTMEDLEALEPYIDLWAPESRRLLMRESAEAELAFYHKQGAFWPYRCALQMDMQPLVSYYRHRGIQEYVLGADGMGLWAFNGWSGDSWAQWDTQRADGSSRFDEGLVYRGEYGPIPSTRLFALRAGIEDFVLLHLLDMARDSASDEVAAHLAAIRKQAEAVLDESEPAPLHQWRQAALATLDKVSR